ncbi:ABC transporter permease [Enterococcus nangangensis]|uniref:ABC transporter permease n=1 Tax=Enterococcus nangangensis TaxID=2559926 RepID=UPI0010F7C064|nr:ABC transporter permease subunit [Enterococcus nangangensis]
MKEVAKESLGSRFKKYWQTFFKQWQLQLMAIPGVVYMIIFSFIPIYGITIAFKSYTVIDTMDSAPWVGLQNFKTIMSDQYFWQSVVNTLGISALKLAFGFILPIIIAIMIYELRDSLFKRVIQTISYLPHFLSWIILGGMLITWMSSNGMINQLLGLFGATPSTNHMLDAGKYWWIASLSDVWKEAGWGTILYLAAMSRIDPTYYEAAKMDGATRIRQIFSITIPMIKGIISLNFILAVSGLFNSNLDQTLVLMNSQNQPKAEVINSYVYRIGLMQGDFSYATAVGLGVSVISVALLALTNIVTKKLNDNKSVL